MTVLEEKTRSTSCITKEFNILSWKPTFIRAKENHEKSVLIPVPVSSACQKMLIYSGLYFSFHSPDSSFISKGRERKRTGWGDIPHSTKKGRGTKLKTRMRCGREEIEADSLRSMTSSCCCQTALNLAATHTTEAEAGAKAWRSIAEKGLLHPSS